MVQGHRLSFTILLGVAVDGAGNVYVADLVKPPHSKNNYIRCGQHARW